MLAPVRMLVEGVVYPAGVALSGGALLWMQSAFAPQVVLAVALVLSVLFAAASGLVGLSFLPSLLRSLRLRAVSPSEYSNCEPGRRFSQSDIRYLLLHPDPEARTFGRDLARRLAPRLLRAEGLGRPPIWEAGATAISRLAQGLSPEWSAAGSWSRTRAPPFASTAAARIAGAGTPAGMRRFPISSMVTGRGEPAVRNSSIRAALSSSRPAQPGGPPPSCSRGMAMRPSAWRG